MNVLRPTADPAVAPSQVWGALAIESQARIVHLLAYLASNLIASLDESTLQETPPCSPVRPPRRSGPSTSAARR